MPAVPIIGSSYDPRVRKAGSERTIGMFPTQPEQGGGKPVLLSLPGRRLFADLGAEIRGQWKFNDRAYAVSGNTFYEVSSAGLGTVLGHLRTSTGPVDINNNRSQIIIVDGSTDGFVYTPATGAFQKIIDPSFTGSKRVAVLGGRALFVRLNSQVFYWSNIDDALTFDPLAFDEANTKSDKLLAIVEDHGVLLMMGETSIEVWQRDDTATFSRIDGVRIDTGLAGAFATSKLDNTTFWLGNDERGNGMTWRMQGWTPIRISEHPLEEKIQAIADISGARSYAYQQDGHSFFVLQVPGLDTTPTYDVETRKWHDRAEIETADGDLAPDLGTTHLYAFGKHLIGAADGKIYYLDPLANTNNGDFHVRERVFHAFPEANRAPATFGEVMIDVPAGEGRSDGTAALFMVRVSKDDGASWGDWRYISMGVVGQRQHRPRFLRAGYIRDVTQYVIQVRCTEDVAFSIAGASIA
jgi:hypothetical protein